MPSIEILALGQRTSSVFDELPFAVDADVARKSHRRPSRFQPDFDQLDGVLYHLGNPNLKSKREGRIFFAYDLLSEESKGGKYLEFAPDFRPHVHTLLARLIAESPEHRLVFTSDWQFGPEWTRREGELSIDQFWDLHDSRRLLLNALYPITG